MNINELNRSKWISRIEMKLISERLVSDLSRDLGLPLTPFKIHIVEFDSLVTTVHGSIPECHVFDLRIEGVVMLQMRNEAPPNINAELLLFSRGERVGLQGQQGHSFVSLAYTRDRWIFEEWRSDSPEDWERIKAPRTSEYNEPTETWDLDE